MKNIEIKKTVTKLQKTKTYSVIARTLARSNPFKNSVLDCFAPLAMTAVIFAFCFLPFISFSQGFSPFVGSGGNGMHGNPYLISTPADLVELSTYVNGDTITTGGYLELVLKSNTRGKYFKMTNDIDMKGIDMSSIGNGFFVDNGAREVYCHFFCGNFDGGGFTIKNFTYTFQPYSSSGEFQGTLFGFVIDAAISNLILDSASTFGSTFVSMASISNFENCIAMNCTVTDGRGGFIDGMWGGGAY